MQVGFERNLTIGDHDLTLITKSLRPLVLEVSNFLTQQECDHIIEKASPHIKKSTVSHMDHDVGKPDANWRTSSTYFMPSDDNTLRGLDQRVMRLTRLPVSHQEYAQVLRYSPGENYVAHHDYFDLRNYARNEQIISMTESGLFNRLATVFFYLTTVESGGHTNFPRAGGLPQPSDFADCSRGVSVAPLQGRVVVFYSLHPSGQLDELSLHGGCKPDFGTKWSANKWIWNKQMGYLS
mmetsp:Transcript_93405/g.250151  ORF Transcript_93405/g.250151 Transcript_93405/m.250151 type:complete len:237 (+) Transcript_93405:455-1165(+)